jgi:DNA repair exonuclease SbcCD ATPase subunit
MDTPKKRLFIEKMFGLEMFSDLNKLAHEKLGMMENQLSNYNTELSIKSKIKNDISQKYSVLNKQVKGLKSSNLELTKTIEKLANLEDPKNLIDLASTSGSKYELQKIEIDQEITKQNTSMDYLNKEKETILGELSKKENLLKQQKSLKEEYEKIIKENNNIDELICSETEILSKCDKEISDLTQLLSDQKLLLVEAETNLEHYSSNLHTLSDKTECPLCMSKINKDTILPNIQTLIKKYESLVTEATIKIFSINEKIKDLTNTKDCTNLKELKKTKVLYQDAIAKLEGVDALIASINIQADQQKLSEINENISKFNIKDLKEKSDLLKKELDKIDKILKVLQKKSETYNKLLTEKTILEEKIIWEEKTRSDLHAQIGSLEKEMSDIDNECNKLNDAIEKLTTLKDYVSYVKTLCKDENIKQYAISSIMPYLTKRINEYLAKAGMSYFVNFNNLLEDDIRGPGIYGASYGNLSGGEARSMDLAILFSLLDISRLQFGVFPDILMLDELLDSSIDKNGIDEIMKIVWLRQMEDNSKIFLVTHRSDWSELTGMRKYKVEKEGGFSSIKEIEE